MTIRNFLTTDIVKNIVETTNFEVVCAVNQPDKYSKYYKHPKVSYIQFYEKKLWSFSNILLLILRRRFYEINQNQTLKILKKGPLFLSFSSRVSSILKYPFPKSRFIFNSLEFLQNVLYKSNNKISKQLKDISPDLVFSTHLVARHEYDYLMTSRSMGIKTLGMVKSFDNLTGKGYLPFKTDYVILWNEVMKKELIEIYNYEESFIRITGVPQFDKYHEKPNINKESFYRKLGLDLNKKTILFSTNHKDLSPDDPLNIDFIQKELNNLNAQLIVRLHQMDDIKRYPKLKLKNVVYQVPGVNEGKSSNQRIANINFVEDLRNTLYYSDITINTASTMTLDAVALGKPVINIAFDWKEKVYSKSVRRYYDFLHYLPIVHSNGTYIVNSKKKLIDSIVSSIESPNSKKEACKKIELQMLDKNHGKACSKVAHTVKDIVSHN